MTKQLKLAGYHSALSTWLVPSNSVACCLLAAVLLLQLCDVLLVYSTEPSSLGLCPLWYAYAADASCSSWVVSHTMSPAQAKQLSPGAVALLCVVH
jgi:hypothetical protein